ncbi:MAG: DUF6607 family protein [Microscillaceae bacterium]|nr:DUF6607 family protein [Microscillaceae bacterium]
MINLKNSFKIFVSISLSLGVFAASAQNKKQEDQAAIKAQCGCYEVTFEYAETFSPDTTYQFHERKKTGGLEWITVAEENQDKIVIQHLLIVGKNHVIKHWRQDWLYQNQDLYSFVKGDHWRFEQLAPEKVKGQWTQKVYQVDDSPRYEGSATWIHVDGRHFWESTVDAPLPRREHTTRNDYNVMRRTNHHEILEYGHLHEQDNLKIIRSEAGDQILALEKGLNTYRKVDESRCQAAQDWWQKNQAFWKEVRHAWDELFARKQDLRLHQKVDDKFLFQYLSALEKEAGESLNLNVQELRSRIKNTIDQYTIH